MAIVVNLPPLPDRKRSRYGLACSAMETRKRSAVRIRPASRKTLATAEPHRVAVFTAIDGTLLHSRTFEAGVSRATIRRLQAAGVPVIPVSVMTLDEMTPIASDLGLRHAMVIEAGGAIARWSETGWEVEPCGPPAETLLEVVREIEERAGANLLVYSALPESEAARFSGRSGEMLRASTHRRFSEPIVIESGDPVAIRKAAADLGFHIRAGRRFLHLCRECDEGEAFSRVRDELGCDVTVAVGGSLIDAEFLSRADISIIVPGPDGIPDRNLMEKVPHARVAPAPAPDGWAAAVEQTWQGIAVPRRRAGQA